VCLLDILNFSQSQVATTGFKRLYLNRATPESKSPTKPRTRLIVQPYQERKAKRLAKYVLPSSITLFFKYFSLLFSDIKESQTLAGNSSIEVEVDKVAPLSLSEASWNELSDQKHRTVHEDSSIPHLPPLSSLEKDGYFGHKARAEFLDIYRQLSRQRHMYKDALSEMSSQMIPAVASASPPKRFTRGRSSSRFMSKGSHIISSIHPTSQSIFLLSFPVSEVSLQQTDSTEEADTSPTSPQPRIGLQNFGKSGILVRTNTTSLNSSVKETAVTEIGALRSHLNAPSQLAKFDRPLSPRTRFLVGCIDENVMPRPSLLIRKEESANLSLEHHSMGDTGGRLLSLALKDLPYLAELNIGDNKLTDRGLTAIIKALHDCPYLTSLDVSENKIDAAAAAELSDYLSSRKCKLVNLVLRKSDVDDNEIGRFIQVCKNIIISSVVSLFHLSVRQLGPVPL
jgi:hypothetical protein